MVPYRSERQSDNLALVTFYPDTAGELVLQFYRQNLD